MRLGVIGDPIDHSLSPALHQPALDALGIPAAFERWQTTAAELSDRIASLRAADSLGASVTVPHKVAVMALVDEVAPAAARVGAVNTVINRGGRLFGDNTDAYGFAASLREAAGESPLGPAVVLGAGGAARAVVVAVQDLGLSSVIVANRRPERAEALVADLDDGRLRAIASDGAAFAEALAAARVAVNATSLGWRPGESPLAPDHLALLPDDALVADLTYRETDLLRAASDRGLRTLDGLGMLIHQGARAFALWTGRDAPLDIMRRAAERARDAAR